MCHFLYFNSFFFFYSKSLPFLFTLLVIHIWVTLSTSVHFFFHSFTLLIHSFSFTFLVKKTCLTFFTPFFSSYILILYTLSLPCWWYTNNSDPKPFSFPFYFTYWKHSALLTYFFHSLSTSSPDWNPLSRDSANGSIFSVGQCACSGAGGGVCGCGGEGGG